MKRSWTISGWNYKSRSIRSSTVRGTIELLVEQRKAFVRWSRRKKVSCECIRWANVWTMSADRWSLQIRSSPPTKCELPKSSLRNWPFRNESLYTTFTTWENWFSTDLMFIRGTCDAFLFRSKGSRFSRGLEQISLNWKMEPFVVDCRRIVLNATPLRNFFSLERNNTRIRP